MRTIFAMFLAVVSFAPLFSAEARANTDRKYADVKAFLQQLASTYPSTTTLFTLGDSDSGDKILGVKIGDGAVHHLVVSTHHGNEYGSTEVALGFAQDIAQKPIPGETIFVIPVLNIQGYDSRIREELTAQGDEQDPNRDYPGPCGTSGPFKLKSTKALADFIDQQNIVASATLHTFFPAVVWPWGISTEDTANQYPDIFTKLAQDATVESQYQIGNSTEVIYPADGCYEDYAYWKRGAWSLLFELGTTHTPDDTELQLLVAQNVPGLRRMMENAPTQPAANHDFTGKCDISALLRDRHEE